MIPFSGKIRAALALDVALFDFILLHSLQVLWNPSLNKLLKSNFLDQQKQKHLT